MASSGRSTGTVPKVKGRPTNTTSRDVEQRRAPISSMPNNLQTGGLDWQQQQHQSSSTQHSRARKTRNTRQTTRDLFDFQLSHERTRPASSADFITPRQSFQGEFQMDSDRPVSYDGDSRRPEGPSISRRQEQPHNTHLDTKNNISRIPDRNQVLSRLNQIRDYVKQTSALMDSLKGSSDPNHIMQAIKLSHMNADLRDSEGRLVQLLNTLNSLAESPEPFDNCSTPEHLERFTQLLDIVKTQEDTCLGLFKDRVLPEMMQCIQSSPNGQGQSRSYNGHESFTPSQSSSRSGSEEPGALPTAAQYAKHQELKLKVEESQKKLQALQEHQAALVALQQKAQHQLREAQAQQGALLASQVENSPDSENVEQLNGRMKTLQDLILNRNEVAHLLGEQDDELEAEHSDLQERLQELHGRKQAMDRLVHEFQTLGESPSSNLAESVPQHNGVNGNHVESSEEEEEEVSVMSDKFEELNRMKSRLAQLQSMVAAVSRGEIPHETVNAALSNTDSLVKPDERERHVLSNRINHEASSSAKPDNIVMSSEPTPAYLEAQVLDIKMKTDELNEAKKRLQQLKDLLGSVGVVPGDDDANAVNTEENDTRRSSQQLVSLEAVQAISREIILQTQSMRSDQEHTSEQLQALPKFVHTSKPHPSNQAKNMNKDSPHRQTLDPQRDVLSSRQLALQAELRAKRQELEELMRKDQGQSSSLNQDTCSETGFSLPETSATWGGSSSSQTALLATVDQDAEVQEQSLMCSSDDALDEPAMEPRIAITSQTPASRQQRMPPLVPLSSYPSNWHQFQPKYDSVHKDPAESTSRSSTSWMHSRMAPSTGADSLGPTYDVPGSIGSSGATPRPPSEAGSANTQSMPWWPIQVQQQLEATNAMCQAMMQQWQQWGPPGPELWWNLQGPMPPTPIHQQQLVYTLSQCCHMLWMQNRELSALHATVQSLQDRVACAERFGLAAGATGGSHENNQAAQPASQHPQLKVSLSTGVFPPSLVDPTASVPTPAVGVAGVSSAHSLPNLCDGPLPPLPPQIAASSNPYTLPPPLVAQYGWPTPHPSRSSAPTSAPSNAGLPPLLQHVPPVTLNNQVPPGIRANNYWDNFRSYSQLNLLSTNTKSNEGHLHNPSPIADRSHNSLRGAEPQQAATSTPTVNTTQQPVRSRKQKLNTEQRASVSSTLPNPPTPVRHAAQHRHSSLPTSAQNSYSHNETLYSELTTLMAQNQSRPDFLPQLFRELQLLSCDSLCQRALQSIREIGHTARGDSRIPDQVNQVRPRSRESLGATAGDRDDLSHSNHCILSADVNLVQSQLDTSATSNESSPDCGEGATSLPLPIISHRQPQHTALLTPPHESSSIEAQAGAVISGGAHGQLDVEIQGLLMQLLPFLKAHREDCCSPALLEAIRQHTISLVPPPAIGLNGFIQGQLDALLEDSLLKFQGCWLRDVGEELLATIAEVLLNELTFFKLLDTVSRPSHAAALSSSPDSSNVLHPEQPCQSSGVNSMSSPEDLLEVNEEDLGAVGPAPSPPQRNCWLPARMREPTMTSESWEARKEVSTIEADSVLGCNGDLAEADQSHEDGRITESATSISGIVDSTSDSLGDAAVSGRNSQAEGIAADGSSSDFAEDEMVNLDDLGAVGDNQVPTEDETWNVEQDRELDQVPTRLEPGGNGPSQQASSPSPSHAASSTNP